MTTAPVTPPPPAPPAPPSTPAGRPGARAIAILTVALGAAVVVATVFGAVVPTVAASLARDETQTLDVSGVEQLRLDGAASTLRVEFADVDEGTLDVRSSGRGSWTFDRDGDVLVVESPRGPFLSWFGAGSGRVTLTLPDELAGLDAELDFGAGSLRAEGEFGLLDLDLGAGEALLVGSADDLTVGLGAGRADLDLAGVRTAQLDVSAGSMTGSLSGSAPDDIAITVSAGSLDLGLPDAGYDITSDVSAGDFTHDLRESASGSTLSVEVAAGDANLRAE